MCGGRAVDVLRVHGACPAGARRASGGCTVVCGGCAVDERRSYGGTRRGIPKIRTVAARRQVAARAEHAEIGRAR